MFMCCTKQSSVINSIYSGQQLFSYIRRFAKCKKALKSDVQIGLKYNVIFVLILKIEDPATTCLTVLDLTVIHRGRHDTQHDDIQHRDLFYDTYSK